MTRILEFKALLIRADLRLPTGKDHKKNCGLQPSLTPCNKLLQQISRGLGQRAMQPNLVGNTEGLKVTGTPFSVDQAEPSMGNATVNTPQSGREPPTSPARPMELPQAPSPW